VTAAFDTNLLLLALDPNTPVPKDANGKPVVEAQKRLLHLVSELSKQRRKVVIPTPVLGEMLLLTQGAGQKYLEKINRSRAFIIAPFDQMAAIELAVMTAMSKNQAKRLKAGSVTTAAKLKFDRQIVAIAKVQGATTIYSNDKELGKFAKAQGIEVIKLEELDLPAADQQMTIEWPTEGVDEAQDHP